ncbi:hypothetical protein RDWZM_009886 [Blomia tropicalis]|uniref:Uncharacterized protein n=1 Tax=Blomia tropicalis TaxID=40697 RepID=A0A9Q0LYB8_BLOTA|nr:hypothetical protein RDWZM_009886 [Blomia tropicalis]
MVACISMVESLRPTRTAECRFCKLQFDAVNLNYHPDICHTTEKCYYIPKTATKKMSNINQSKMQELLERMETTMNDFERANVVVDSAQLLIRASRIMNDLLAKHLSLSITASEHLQDTGTKECRFCRILLDEKGLAYYPDIRHITEHCYYVPKIIRKTLIDNNELCYDYFYPGHTFDLCPFMDRYCKFCNGDHNYLICFNY